MHNLSAKKIITCAFAAFLITNTLVNLFGGYFNPGDFVVYFMSIPSVLVLVPNRFTGRKIKRICEILLMGLFILTVMYTVFLYGACLALRLSGDEKVGLVLGASLVDDVPGPELSLRCDAGYLWAKEDPERILIPTGGTGEKDHVSQGEAMGDYMAQRGIAPERIYPESRSVNTEQNMKLSLELMRELGYTEEEPIVIISCGYHIFRSWCYARWAGFENISAYPSRVRVFALLPDMYREAMATVKLLLRLTGIMKPAPVAP
ncbi:MAG: YdcF family protein [Eubacteriaceae bacterium]|nr:YdcF family protein [Eubacteriaceae bacterium]